MDLPADHAAGCIQCMMAQFQTDSHGHPSRIPDRQAHGARTSDAHAPATDARVRAPDVRVRRTDVRARPPDARARAPDPFARASDAFAHPAAGECGTAGSMRSATSRVGVSVCRNCRTASGVSSTSSGTNSSASAVSSTASSPRPGATCTKSESSCVSRGDTDQRRRAPGASEPASAVRPASRGSNRTVRGPRECVRGLRPSLPCVWRPLRCSSTPHPRLGSRHARADRTSIGLSPSARARRPDTPSWQRRKVSERGAASPRAARTRLGRPPWCGPCGYTRS